MLKDASSVEQIIYVSTQLASGMYKIRVFAGIKKLPMFFVCLFVCVFFLSASLNFSKMVIFYHPK